MKIIITSPPLADDTMYGYELRYLDMARALVEAGVKVEDFKKIASNISWAYEAIQKEMQEQIRSHCEKIYVNKERRENERNNSLSR